ncbi:MAG: hypothetical protein KY428_11005 [Bacteroidetes bacterium]|nr:hypothetical protein [Bacteroidota bacterium]
MQNLCCLLLLLSLLACNSPEFHYGGRKLEGVSLVAPPQPFGTEVMQELGSVGVEWVSLMPYACTNAGETVLQHNLDRQWWGERDSGLVESVRLAKETGVQVMLKPHLWLQGGGFTGDLEFTTTQEWQAWERAYTEYIIHYARLADLLQLPLFCIGTELTRHNQQRPQYWQQLIDTVRTLYRGKLTYAANWDAVGDFVHWDQLDYIGVDAYFPLQTSAKPSLEELEDAWQPHLDELRQFSGSLQKPVLFTEWGYRSIQGATKEPWRSDLEGKADPVVQALAYQAFFQAVWPQPWLAGAFLWKWYPSLPGRRHRTETDFTPQGKPAMQVIQQHYAGQEEAGKVGDGSAAY